MKGNERRKDNLGMSYLDFYLNQTIRIIKTEEKDQKK